MRSRAARLLVTPALGACLSCSFFLKIAGYPPDATREEPPSDIEKRALAVGSRAPELSLPAQAGRTWALEQTLKEGPVVLVFYRGQW